MWTNYQNKEQPYINLQHPNRLFQVFFFFTSTLNNRLNLDINKKTQSQLQYLKVGHYLFFLQFKATYTVSLTHKD